MQKQIAIQMDNIETIDFEFDTSFLIGYEAQQRNYKIFSLFKRTYKYHQSSNSHING